MRVCRGLVENKYGRILGRHIRCNYNPGAGNGKILIIDRAGNVFEVVLELFGEDGGVAFVPAVCVTCWTSSLRHCGVLISRDFSFMRDYGYVKIDIGAYSSN